MLKGRIKQKRTSILRGRPVRRLFFCTSLGQKSWLLNWPQWMRREGDGFIPEVKWAEVRAGKEKTALKMVPTYSA